MVFSLIGALGLRFWIPDLASQFFVQYLVFQLVFFVFLSLCKKKYQALSIVPFMTICLFKILPCYFTTANHVDNPNSHESKNRLSLLHMNVNAKNTQYENIVGCVERYEPDVVLFEEVTSKCFRELKTKLPEKYILVESKPQENNFGIAMFSKIPILKSKLISLGYAKVPSITGVFEKNGKKVEVFGVHTYPPLTKETFTERNLQYDEIALVRSKAADRFVLLGDLNNTVWSAYFKDLLSKSKLIDSSGGRGIQPTWHVYFMVMALAIDHCLHSEHFKVLKRETGPAFGSDHYPLYLELAIVE